jgi:hypothetical protein
VLYQLSYVGEMGRMVATVRSPALGEPEAAQRLDLPSTG